ncbi:MAG: methyltransferase domain-containing protein [Candidatus Woesearchaeota archaeon]|jgi:2-polyprenyl-3-methyl-5-hydroxy-6-metoxy-1,4-benzoquinol methylase
MVKISNQVLNRKEEIIDIFSGSYCIKFIHKIILIILNKKKYAPNINSFNQTEFIISKENINELIKKNKAITTSGVISKNIHIMRFFLLLLFFVIFIYSIIKHNIMLLSIALIYFIFDFIFYRHTSKSKYKRELLILKEIINRGFYNIYFCKDNFEDTIVKKQYTSGSRNYFLKPGYDYTAYKEKILLTEFDSLNLKNQLILDVGGAEGQSSCILNKENKLFVSDLNISCLSDAKKRNIIAVQSISENLPFKENRFDVIIFTEVIEHVQNPFVVLKEIKKVLKPGGILILTTGNNRSFFSAFCVNPLILLEKIISQYYDQVLPPRRLISTDQHTYYHVNYSKNELYFILKSSGFIPGKYYTFGSLLFLSRIFPLSLIMKIDNVFINLNITKYLGSGFFMIAKKEETQNSKESKIV